MPEFMSGKRRVVIAAAVGALTVTTAVSAAAASLPSTSAAGSSTVTRTSGTNTMTDAITATMAQADLALEKARAASVTKAQQAKLEAAAVKAAAAKAYAAKVAAEQRAHAIYLNRLAQEKAAASSSSSTSSSSTSSTSSSSSSGSSTSYSGSPEEIAQEMLGSYGWSGQYSCLYDLWEQESDWNVSAYNAGSGAYGIPQALPGSKMASAGSDWQTDAATQITWGLEYIESTYGSPCAAWDHEESDGWY
jgi:hypothetical protein